MKWMLATAFAAAIVTASISAADAKGCIKGANKANAAQNQNQSGQK